jgi:hypothetical protein
LPACGGRAGAIDAAAAAGPDRRIARRGDHLGALDNAFLASGSSRRATAAGGIAVGSGQIEGFAADGRPHRPV